MSGLVRLSQQISQKMMAGGFDINISIRSINPLCRFDSCHSIHVSSRHRWDPPMLSDEDDDKAYY